MKAKPASRILTRKKVSTEEKAEFAEMGTKAAKDTTMKDTDMSDDDAINAIWNTKGRQASETNSTKLRADLKSKKKPVRKLIGMCLKECPTNKEGMNFFLDKKTKVCYKCKDDCQKCGVFEGECGTCAFG